MEEVHRSHAHVEPAEFLQSLKLPVPGAKYIMYLYYGLQQYIQ